MIVAYARKTIDNSYIQEQLQHLNSQNFDTLYIDAYQENKQDYIELDEAINKMSEGDTLIIYQLDCLGKTLYQLQEFMNVLKEKGIYFQSIGDHIEIKDYDKSEFIHYLNLLAKTDNKVKSENTIRGLESAREKGRIGGRPKISEETIKQIQFLYNNKAYKLRDIAAECNVSLGTAQKYAKKIEQQ